MNRRRVVVVGATGTFGCRLARHLAGDSAFELVLTARQRSRALALRAALARGGARATLRAIAFERVDSPGVALARLAPWAVVDCSGSSDTADFALAIAALSVGAHFVDLADAPAGTARRASALDAWARDMGAAAIAGAGTVSGPSDASAVALAAGWQWGDAGDIAILPAAAALRALVDGRLAPGVHEAGAVLSLADIMHEMSARALDAQPDARSPHVGPIARPAPVHAADGSLPLTTRA